MRNDQWKKGNRKMPQQWMIAIFVVLILVCLFGGMAFAKYYASKSSKGVATASGLYFSSNVLKDITGTNELQDIYNTDSWNGETTYTFDVQIRNYQNQLLYNDGNLNIYYNITFSLEGEADGANYTVTKETGSDQEVTAEGVTFENVELSGGQAKSNYFAVKVTPPSGANASYISRGIKVVATPVSPDYVAESYELGGILYAKVVAAEYTLNYGFNVESQLSSEGSWTTADKNIVNALAGFPWTMTSTADKENSTHRIIITWDSTLLQINQYDKYYKAALEENRVTKVEATDTTHEFTSLLLDMQPYSSVDITFFKTSNFHCESTVTSKAQLHGLVTVVDETVAE